MQMANHSSAIFGRYSFFSKMDAALEAPTSDQISTQFHHLSYYIALACILLGAYFFKLQQNARRSHVDAPYYKASLWKWMFDAEAQIIGSYNKFHGRVYLIRATEGMQLVLPPAFVAELKSLPEETLSATAAMCEAMLSEYTHFHFANNGDLLAALVKTKLAQNATHTTIVPRLKEEIDVLVAEEFPECRDWTTLKIQPFTLRAVTRMAGRIFVGPEINRLEDWVETNINFVVHVFMSVAKLQFMPQFLRPIGQYLVPDVRRTAADLDKAGSLLKPIIDQRMRDKENFPGYEAPADMISWLLESLSDNDRTDIAVHAQLQLMLAMASGHGTNNIIVDCIFDLAENQDLQDELRAEVEAAYATGAPGSDWTKEKLLMLKKMDSLMKEVQRLRGNLIGFHRKVLKPISLSDGTYLPPGTKLLVPQAGISRDEAFYQSPDTFDPMRFYKLRQRQQEQDSIRDGGSGSGDEDSARHHQFTAIGDTNVNFGGGRHACPGRFFACTEIKLLLAYFLRNYEFRLKPGEGRPKPFTMMMSKVPNPNGEVQFRRRECADY
ncbi:hypothetical protein PpBr36_07524 [Pyricularia pennisetigena]|uniref:hypothetical protein n=1 Tax=Pyricularia pennisetigena TaxID=1578925 RepID=UPI00114D96B7|nr:hypothetical protein PpBr36_07524 [Pyricularia pennisetigena]TLS25746.1 hypothetical protein PpBr36_07524 [Pyricularia pennisetigena]